MALYDSSNRKNIDYALFVRVVSGGVLGGVTATADAAATFRNMGYLSSATESFDGGSMTKEYAMPASSEIDVEIKNGAYMIEGALLEAHEDNLALRAIALGVNPNNYDGSATSWPIGNDELSELIVEVKLVELPKDVPSSLASVSNAMCTHIKRAIVDPSGYSTEGTPRATQTEKSTIPIKLVAVKDPDEVVPVYKRRLSSVDIQSTSTNPFATDLFA